jgi:dTDP-glucose pyrophosphorylase/CBS domain-containing protein
MTDSTSRTRLERVTISSSASIAEAIALLDKAGTGALALCSDSRKLLGLLTDGDIRRAILKSRPMDDSCHSAANLEPIVALWPVASVDALNLMNHHDINHLPVVDADGVLVDFILRRDLSAKPECGAASSQRLQRVVTSPNTSIKEAIGILDKAGTGALILCTGGMKLCGLLTDGDIRRAILHGKSMDGPCIAIASRTPVVAPRAISTEEALRVMNEHDINHLPVVDEDSCVIELLLRKDLVTDVRLDLSAVIMAGGYGKRLLPLTESLPKPMLPVGNRPVLELIIQKLSRSGIRDVNLTTHYLPESISNHFGNGENFGVKLTYVREDNPMGTAGGLKQMKRPDGPFLVINGDVLTDVPFKEMLTYHRKHAAMLTVGVRKYDVQVPFGVVECEDVQVTKIQEKPSFSFFINAGTYLLEPAAWDQIPDHRPFDMTDLIQKLLEAGESVVGFPIIEYWLDIGKPEDYEQAKNDIVAGRFA